jgi:hypothetical protein
MGSVQRQHNPHTPRGETHGLQRASITGIYHPVIKEAAARRLGFTDFFLGPEVITSVGNGTAHYEIKTLQIVANAMAHAAEVNKKTFRMLDLCPQIFPLRVSLTDAAPRLAVLAIDRRVDTDPDYFAAGFEILARRTNDILAETTTLKLPVHE